MGLWDQARSLQTGADLGVWIPVVTHRYPSVLGELRNTEERRSPLTSNRSPCTVGIDNQQVTPALRQQPGVWPKPFGGSDMKTVTTPPESTTDALVAEIAERLITRDPTLGEHRSVAISMAERIAEDQRWLAEQPDLPTAEELARPILNGLMALWECFDQVADSLEFGFEQGEFTELVQQVTATATEVVELVRSGVSNITVPTNAASMRSAVDELVRGVMDVDFLQLQRRQATIDAFRFDEE